MLAEREYEVAPEVTPVPEIVPPVPSDIVDPVGKDDTPIAEANSAYVLDDPVVPDVLLPPTSKVNWSAPLTVTTAPLDSVN